MTPKTLDDYGAPKGDALPIEDETTQLAADQYNELAEDCAQLTRTAPRAIVTFNVGTSPAVTSAVSVWGGGLAQQPTILHPSLGNFVVIYPATMVDGLGNAESLNFRFAHAAINSTFPAHIRVDAIGANNVSVWTLDNSFAPNDLGVSYTVTIWIY